MNNQLISRKIGLLLGVVAVGGALAAVVVTRHHGENRAPTKSIAADDVHEAAEPAPEANSRPLIAVENGVPEAVEPKRAEEAPPVEPAGVIETMTENELRDTVSEIARELLERNAIGRLNSGAATDSERAEFGSLMHRHALMQGQLARLAAEDLEREVADYEKVHNARVAKYLAKDVDSPAN